MSGQFARLVDLARERSSEKRRELLREVTDLFFVAGPSRTAEEAALFDAVLRDVAVTMQDTVLRELADRFCDVADAPVGLMRDLANHSFDVAEPVLRRSRVLADADLVQIVEAKSEEYRRAIAQRPEVSEDVSRALVAVGDDATLCVLVANEGARLSRADFETVFERARTNDALTAGVVARKDAPLDLLNEIVLAVSAELRTQILARNAAVDPEELDMALERARARMKSRLNAPAESYAEAEGEVRKLVATGKLNAAKLVAFYRENMHAHFLVGLAYLTEVEVAAAEQIIARGDMDALAMMCRSAGIERPLFVTIAVLACGGQRAMGKAEEYGHLYNAVPIEAAQRAMRFYRVRRAHVAADAAVA